MHEMPMSESPDPVAEPLTCRWCREPAMAAPIASFFVSQVNPAYISHAELQVGRAVAPGRWADDLAATIAGEAQRAIGTATEAVGLSGTRVAVLTTGGTLRGIAFVTFTTTARRPFATLEDMLVDTAWRGEGLGQTLLDWIIEQCRAGGVPRLFLESGIDNGRAHHFFDRNGFVPTSIVMMREL